MVDADVLVPAALLAVGLAAVVLALLGLPSGSRVRRLYGVGDGDDVAARRNSLALAAVGLLLAASGVAIRVDLPERAVGVAVVGGTGVLCLVLGWLVRFRDRRDLLTTPNVDRETARRLGAVTIATGVGCLALALAILLDVPENILATAALAGGVVLFVAIAAAYR